MLSYRRTRDANDRIKESGCIGLEQERNHHHPHRNPFAAPALRPLLPDLADARVQNGFQTSAGDRIGEDLLSELTSKESAVRPDEFPAKRLADFPESRF